MRLDSLTNGAKYWIISYSGPLPNIIGCWCSSSFATAEARIPMGLSEGGMLEWPGLPATLSSSVNEPFSVTPILKSKLDKLQIVLYSFIAQ